MIDEQNKLVEEEIKQYEDKLSMCSSDKQKTREQLYKMSEEMKASIAEKQNQITFIEGQMAAITDSVKNMVTMFNTSNFQGMQSVSSHQDYDADLKFNENNVTTYLSELEEYVTHLISFLFWRHNENNFQYASLDLDGMKKKDFEQGPPTIEAPNTNDFHNQEDETDIGDDLVTDPQAKIR